MRARVQTMRDLVDRNASLHADDLHQVFADRRTTFRFFAERAYRLANALHALGLQQQDRVAILAMNCAEYLEVCGVAEVAPFIVAPVNFRLASAEIAYILDDVKPRILVFEQQYTDLIEKLRAELRGIEHFIMIGDTPPDWASAYEEVLASGSPHGAPWAPQPLDIHTVIYTSGTTGRPKGVMLTHDALLALGEAWAYELGSDVGDRILLAMPLFHIGARSQGAAVMIRGGTQIVHRAFDATEIIVAIERERVSQLHLAPTLMQAVLDLPELDRYDLSSLRTINYAAAPMPLTTLKRAIERFGKILINGYGQTEGSGLTLRKHYHRPDGTPRDLKRLTSVGQAVYDTDVKIVDDSDIELPTETIGEICLLSRQNMIGYWNNSVATIEALRGGWLHTGDLGYIDEDRFVYLVDRKKDMIISGGENVYSREVEEALMEHLSVADVAVIGLPDPKWGEAVMAVVVLKQDASGSAEELIAHCHTLIAGYKCPKSIEFVTELPRLPSGKISKVTLRKQLDNTL